MEEGPSFERPLSLASSIFLLPPAAGAGVEEAGRPSLLAGSLSGSSHLVSSTSWGRPGHTSGSGCRTEAVKQSAYERYVPPPLLADRFHERERLGTLQHPTVRGPGGTWCQTEKACLW